jgi:hypothetical protein
VSRLDAWRALIQGSYTFASLNYRLDGNEEEEEEEESSSSWEQRLLLLLDACEGDDISLNL